MNKRFTYFICIIVAAIVFQGCSINARIKRADKQFEAGEYYAVSSKYRKILRRIPSKSRTLKSHVAFNMGECFRAINYTPQAENAYLNAIKLRHSDSLVYLRYAQTLQRNGKYADAVKNYQIYLKNDTANRLAKTGLNAVKIAEALKAHPTTYVVKKADLAFNARRSWNFSPAYSGCDADAMYFTSNRSLNTKSALKPSTVTGLPLNKMYSTRKNAAGKWEKPALIGSDVNTIETDDGVCCFSPDGKIIYFTRAFYKDESAVGAKIFYANKAGGTWSDPKEIEIFKDSTISVAHPAIAPDGETLYFVSDNEKGFGGKDIWKAKLSGGNCTEIENMGPQFNTPGDEMFPTVKYDGTLYFSSNGLPGLGGLDVFKATPKEDGWKIENVGVPVNSNADDFGMAFEGKNERGFFSSNRGEARGYDALWSFELPVYEFILEGRVLDDKSNPVPDAVVKLVSNTGINTRVTTKKDGSFRIKIDKKMECIMLATARGYLNKEATLKTPDLKENKVFKQDIILATIYKPIQLINIFYEFGKWDLTPQSEAGLQELVKTLNDNPNITIEISAHTDYIGTNESNKILSEKRAQSVVNYLIKAGINPERLSSSGYGEEKPVVVDATTAQKYNFLKENDVLDENYVLKLKPDQQEIVNKINRRTEFRVLKTNFKPKN
jgi:peptidoglycan-associated lipoprotein